MNKLQELKQKQKELSNIRKEILQKSNEVFDEFSKEIFKKHSKLESFSWSQYTPYFNDGDTCVFSVNIDYLYINGEAADESKWISKNNIVKYGSWDRESKQYVGREEEPNPNYDDELVACHNEIVDFLNSFDNDFYLSRFGDHVDITVTSSGVDIDECEHD